MSHLNSADAERSDQHAVEPKAHTQGHHAKERSGSPFFTRADLSSLRVSAL
jgi:hypothetical protein